jgi:molybdate transport system ATP-binding protein
MSLLAAGVRARRGAFELNFELQAERGETLAVIGASGSGKTTLLRCIAGLLRPLAGSIKNDGSVWSDATGKAFVPPHQRDIGMVFAHGALFDHLSALENVAFGMRAAGVAQAQAARRALTALEVTGADHLAPRSARSLSTGERQRVAIARAIALRPAVMLLDEPLANLDLQLRPLVRDALLRALDVTRATTVLVTHEPPEALLFAEHFVVLEGGNVAQSGDLDALRTKPKTEYVASFAGTNLYRGLANPLQDGTSLVQTENAQMVVQGRYEGRVGLVIDPDAVTLSVHEPESSARNHFSGLVESIIADRGAFRVTLAGVPRIAARVTAASLASMQIVPGTSLFASFKAVEAHIL